MRVEERKDSRMNYESEMQNIPGITEKEQYPEKKSRGLLRVIFSRTTFLILFLLVQLGVLFACFKWLDNYMMYVYGGFNLLTAVVVLHIVNRPMNPSLKLSWIIPVLVTPVFGSLFYLYVQGDLLTKGLARGLKKKHEESLPYRKNDEKEMEALRKEDEQCARLAWYLRTHGDFPIYTDTDVEYFPLGEDKWKRMLEELKKAEKFIFLEYFIVDEGVMWSSILDILKEKASQGVEVRMMYDGTCAISTLPFSYPKKLEAMGIRCKMFSPVRPLLSTVQNNRDHRKILVIDGHTGFTGGVNLADEYVDRRNRYGHWKDTAVMLKGEAVQSLTLMFLEMWDITERTPVNWEQYCVDYTKTLPEKAEEHGTAAVPEDSNDEMPVQRGYVIPYGDSPMDNEPVGEYVYLDILNTAKRYVHIMTPYLILDNETITALSYAAKRGIETIIIMPHIPDKQFAYLLARTYYPELLEAGVRIYEYTPGFVHAKVFVSDDIKAVVGTINLDYRSLYLHFECAAYMYRCPVVPDVEKDFQQTLAKCQKITLEDCRKFSKLKLLEGKILRLIAPLM